MYCRSVFQRTVLESVKAVSTRRALVRAAPRLLYTTQAQQAAPQQTTAEQPKSWLTRKVESSPAAKKVFLGIAKALGYGSPQQVAGRRAFLLYEKVAAVAPDQGKEFWQKGASFSFSGAYTHVLRHVDCFLPATFQSWFTITDLHVWLLAVRLRALPPEHGRHYVQGLLDHFFIDVEDRIRMILQPTTNPPPPYTFQTNFYTNPNTRFAGKRGSRAPDKIVNRQLKIFKEQWGGLFMSLDLGLVKDDDELAAAIWRNILGARGAQGITYEEGGPKFRRAVNLVGGEVVNVAKLDFEKEQTTDDGSGVHDFAANEIDNYLAYPELMLDLVGYIRRETLRLSKVSDEDIMSGDWTKLKFGPVKV